MKAEYDTSYQVKKYVSSSKFFFSAFCVASLHVQYIVMLIKFHMLNNVIPEQMDRYVHK